MNVLMKRPSKSYGRSYIKYWALFKISFKDRMSSPIEVFVRSIFFAAVIFIFSRLWGALGSPELVWYLFITESIVLSLPASTELVDHEIQTGSIAYQLVRPLNYVANRAMGYLGEVCARFWVNALVGFITAVAMVGLPQHVNLPMLGWIGALICGAFLIHLGLSLSLSMLGFWVEDTLPFFWIYSKMAFIFGGLFMPIDFYPEWLRGVCRKLPFQDSVYSVAKVAIGLSDGSPISAILIRQLSWAAGGMVMASILYRVGIERLEARGG